MRTRILHLVPSLVSLTIFGWVMAWVIFPSRVVSPLSFAAEVFSVISTVVSLIGTGWVGSGVAAIAMICAVIVYEQRHDSHSL